MFTLRKDGYRRATIRIETTVREDEILWLANELQCSVRAAIDAYRDAYRERAIGVMDWQRISVTDGKAKFIHVDDVHDCDHPVFKDAQSAAS